MSLNKIVIMGRFVRDPELRTTASGTEVANFALAVERDYSGRDGTEKVTDFIDVTVWGKTASFVSKYFTKGKMAVAVGSLQSKKWTDKDGNSKTFWSVNAEHVYFTGNKDDFSKQSEEMSEESLPLPHPTSGDDFAQLLDDDSNLPF